MSDCVYIDILETNIQVHALLGCTATLFAALNTANDEVYGLCLLKGKEHGIEN